MKIKNILLFVVLLTGLLFGCSTEAKTEYAMIIGSTGEGQVDEIKETFKVGETVSIELEGNKAIGTPITTLFTKNDGTTKSIIGRYEEHIDPTWEWIYYTFEELYETGNYTIRIFNKEDELLGEVNFNVVD